MRKNISVGIIILFLSSCGQLDATSIPTKIPKPIVAVTISSTSISTPTSISSPEVIKDTPTAVLAKGLAPEKFSKYVGIYYPPLPNGLSQSFALLIWDPNNYGISLVSDGENRMLWLDKLTHHDSDGKAHWEVKDILELPNFEGEVTLIPDGCLLNGEFDYEIFVVGEWDDEVFVSRFMPNDKILMAWRANTTLEIFEVISTNGIECHADNGILLK